MPGRATAPAEALAHRRLWYRSALESAFQQAPSVAIARREQTWHTMALSNAITRNTLTEPRGRRWVKRGLRLAFELGQRAGVNLLPRHFYSQVPEIAHLRRSTQWRAPHSMIGIRGADEDAQLQFVSKCCIDEVLSQLPSDLYAAACRTNGAVGFGPIESQFLYCFIASKRPTCVIQIGCGVATAVMIRAREAFDVDMDVICVDPYPTDYLRRAAAANQITLLAQSAQDVPLETLTDVGEGGMFFVDSTHTVKPGSEVNRIILEVLPRLRAGSYVHYHDILFPFDYTPGILSSDLFFWNESVLLQAFLTCNPRYEILAAFSMLHYERATELSRVFPDYRPARHVDGLATHGVASGDSQIGHFPSSLYLQVGDGDSGWQRWHPANRGCRAQRERT